MTVSEEAIWHEVECGGYDADLPVFEELARAAAGPVLELGAGTGRVALALAASGLEVVAVDRSPALIDALRSRAAERALACDARVGDARELDLDREFAAILAPMQFVHLLADATERGAMLAGVRAHVRSGGLFAAALLNPEGAGAAAAAGDAAPLPDVREVDGWVYSSLPVEIARDPGAFVLRRLRQRVSPAGELSESIDSVTLAELRPEAFEAECERAGLTTRERIEISPTREHVGSVVCVLEEPR